MTADRGVWDYIKPGGSFPVRGICAVDGDSASVRYAGEDAEEFSLLVFEVRLFGIDAPEKGNWWRPEQDGALESRDHLNSLICDRALTFDYRVKLEGYGMPPDYRESGKPKPWYYPRLVGILRRSGKSSVNYNMIRDGWAYSYTTYGALLRGDFAQALAKVNSLGLWALPDESRGSPSEHRKRYRKPYPKPYRKPYRKPWSRRSHFR